MDRGVEQLVAREAHNLEVIGSSPVPATLKAVSFDLRRLFLFLGLILFLGSVSANASAKLFKPFPLVCNERLFSLDFNPTFRFS